MDGTASGLKFTISLYLKLKSVQLGERPAVLVESGINMDVYVSIIIRLLCNIGTFLSINLRFPFLYGQSSIRYFSGYLRSVNVYYSREAI